MLALTADQYADIAARHPDVVRSQFWTVWRVPALAAATVVYLMFCWWVFGIGQVLANTNWQIAGSYLVQWVTYEYRPTISIDRDGAMAVTFPRFDPIGPNPKPDWMTVERAPMERRIAAPKPTGATAGGFMAGGGFMAPDAAPAVSATPPTVRIEEVVKRAEVRFSAGARLVATPDRIVVEKGGETLVVPLGTGADVQATGPLPAWAAQKRAGDRIIVTFGLSGWAQIDGGSVAVHRRFPGWVNFVFDTNSAFFGKSAGEILHLIAAEPRLDLARSNLAVAVDDFLYNPSWQHLDVWTKLLETVVMAFIGTLFAAIVAFPLSFIAARNITVNWLANQTAKRFFDFLRSVDMLIWALFFTRAFGPGPISGMAAIFFTDTGSLGKLFSEALENIDGKPRDGLTSVGAAPIAVQRFGVLPQVLPVFVSQTLYFWESNTRSATIIGAMGAGGIGLKLWEAMRTHTNWPNIFYMVILIIGTVFIFDTISNALRSRLTGRAQS
ncbi:phosphonate ABC transporter, permease protein PhnE [Pleomorphomonas carboxyditropha]|uniref:Phosphonate ABC transporter, permease protein PhnE n=1 Tax=Pleomorphomonas carboxyditropha TaxID=2023338 RepID=A0A2G9X2Z3_9HYPH|nr:phosphonate ABC transporter, permease protein PhnE [Pleomorphomonas carboxyditropha]PIP01294.1 phosphonate ABC transporter, permease protein PhnE [Pleomorphomonas carboxyditropha]